MKRLNIARRFYPRLRYTRISISSLLTALLGRLTNRDVVVPLGVVMASLVPAEAGATMPTHCYSPGLVRVDGQWGYGPDGAYISAGGACIKPDPPAPAPAPATTATTSSISSGAGFWDEALTVTTTMTSTPRGSLGKRSDINGKPAAGYEWRGGSIAYGMEFSVDSDRCAGIAAIIAGNKVETLNRKVDQEIASMSYQLATYGKQRLGESYTLSVLGNVGYDRAHSSRMDVLLKAHSRQNILHINLASELARKVDVGKFTLIQQVGIEYGIAHVAAYKEYGAGLSNLAVESQRAESLISSVGLRASYPVSAYGRVVGALNLGYDALARTPELTATDASGVRVNARGGAPGNAITRAELAYEYRTPAGTRLRAGLDYMGRSGGFQDYAIRLEWVIPLGGK